MKLSAHDDFRPVNPDFKRMQLLPELRDVSRDVVSLQKDAVAVVGCLPQAPVAMQGSEQPPGRLANGFS